MYNDLIKWSQKEFEYLPWRRMRSLYHTLVSEIMLQQTTVQTVLNHFEKFISYYPNLESIANESEENIIKAWKGLGYYRRARNLKAACEKLCHEYDGKFPLSYHSLKEIAGIGEYTANAILAIGANDKALAIDANIERVISRIYAIREEKGVKLQRKIKDLFQSKKILQENFDHNYRALNEALMDLGRVYCQAHKAYCELCPISNSCKAFQMSKVKQFPFQSKSEKEKVKFELNLLRLIVLDENKIICYQKKDDEWLSSQRELPTYVLSCEDKNFTQYPYIKKLNKNFYLLPFIQTSITHYKIFNYLLILDKSDFASLFQMDSRFEWKVLENDLNLSTASLKALSYFNIKSQEER